MENVVLTSATQISPKGGCPLNAQPTVTEDTTITLTMEPNIETQQDSIDSSNVDGNFQAKVDVNYQAHDVALTAAKSNGTHEHTNGLKVDQHHEMNIDNEKEHSDKVKSSCSISNALLLASAIVCFALLLCMIAIIVSNQEKKNKGTRIDSFRILDANRQRNLFSLSDQINDQYFNLTSQNSNGIRVVLSRRGASIHDILIPYKDDQDTLKYRSIILKDDQLNSIRFGFDGLIDLDNQLPDDYPLLNSFNQDWLMYGDYNAPYRIRFVNGLAEVIYEFSLNNPNELIMTTIVSTKLNEKLIADPTNNIYFNLRGYGTLNSHYWNSSDLTLLNIEKGQEIEKKLSIQQQTTVDQLNDVNKYFYKIDRVGIGKNFIGTLFENETNTKLNIFADHFGMTMDIRTIESSQNNKTMEILSGIRISPRQSPVYETMGIYGATLIIHPSQAIHTTWWQFEYQM